ncbi:MAG: hypothetical protein Q8P18_03985 [Pseudomonadota bacterium]|nr:hypothetical protein [Pseudomonadota bacterium]
MARGEEEYVVVPDGWLSRGEAFVRGDHAQLAVFGGIPGERAKVRLIERGSHQHRARFVKADGRGHPDRVEPPCDRYVPCGRCPLMHLNPAGQDRARMGLLKDAFVAERAPQSFELGAIARAEGFPVDAAGASHTIELIAGWSDERHLRLGVPGKDGRRVVPIPLCHVATEPLRRLMSTTAYHLKALDIYPWEGHRGTFRGLFARQSATTGEIFVTLVFGRPSNYAKSLAEAIAGQLTDIAGVFAHWNDEPGPLLFRDPVSGDADVTLVYGRTSLEEDVSGLRIRLGALDPFPGYPKLGVAAWEGLVDALAPAAGDTVVDLGAAAGAGARTLLLAKRAGWALGIDPHEGVIRRARENAAANSISADFVSGPFDEGLEVSRPRLAGRRPIAVVDVGPKGVDAPTMELLLALDLRRVALVSNNPRALARDIARLVGGGLRLERLLPYDTAPHTMFGDTVALLTSADTTAPTLRAPRRKTIRAI